MIRQPIVTICGHVDHGKSTILEKIKDIAITKGEAGGITQTIKSYNLPLEQIKKFCGNLLNRINLTIPGLLFIDTPGHEAFTNLRKRGGSLADIAILVIDINEGIKKQTKESIEILKDNKTPFVIALNKIDLIPGFKLMEKPLLETLNSQPNSVKEHLDKRLYELLGEFYEMGLAIERYDRIDDFTKTVAVVPVSAKKDQGLPDLLMVITGLAQKYLEKCLKCDVDSPAKGTILEVTEEKGLGTILDTIIYDGTIKIGDQIVIGALGEPVSTKVKALLMIDNKKLQNVKEAHAAVGVKISAQNIKDVIAGMPLKVVDKNTIDQVINEIREEIQETTFDIDESGIIIKADTLGSLEAFIHMLKEKEIKIKHASIGEISKKDVSEAVAESDPFNKVILGFNVKPFSTDQVHVITDPVIYKVLENYEEWREKEELKHKEQAFKDLPSLFKIQIIRNCVFRQSNPAVVGVEVMEGVLKSAMPLLKDNHLADIKEIQKDGKTVKEAKKGEQVAMAVPGVTVGRQIHEEDIFYTYLTEEQFRKFKKLKKYLNDDQILILKEIALVMRVNQPMWGV